MKMIRKEPSIFVCLVVILSLTLTAGLAVPISSGKIEPGLLTTIDNTSGLIPVIVNLAGELPAGEIKGKKVEAVQQFKLYAEAKQKEILDSINIYKSQGEVKDVKPLGIANAIALKATPEAIRELAGRSDVRLIEPDAEMHILGYKGESLLQTTAPSTQVVSPDVAWGVEKIGAPAVWASGIEGSGIVVAVVDTGIDSSHPDLDDLDDDPYTSDPKLTGWIDYVNGYMFPYDDNGHGTHVSGTISGTGANGIKTGVAPKTNLMAAKVFNESGFGSTSDTILAFEWAALNGADIISYSGGGPHVDAMTTTINNLVAAGVLPVAAAGNSGPSPGSISDPGDEKNSTTVGATDIADMIASFSSRGPVTLYGETYIKPDVSAPGVSVMSTIPGGGYEAWDGTSMATPHVSGTAALMLQANPALTPQQIKSNLENTAVDLGTPGKDNSYGSGRIDAYKAVFGGGPVGLKVAIYASEGGPDGTALKNMLNANGYEASIITKTQVEAGALTNYSVFVYGHGSGQNTQAFKDAVRGFLVSGGGMITEWSSSAVMLSNFGPNLYFPYENWDVFNGTADYGGSVGTNTPIDIINNSHPIFQGVLDPFEGGDSTEFFYTTQNLDSRLQVVAQYTGHGGTWPAIAVAGGIKPSGTKVLFYEGHVPSGNAPGYYSTADIYKNWTALLSSKGMTVSTSTALTLNSTVLGGYDVVVIAEPTIIFSSQEISALNQFIGNGGGLLLLGEWGPFAQGQGIYDSVNGIGVNYGINFNLNTVTDNINNDGNNSMWPIIPDINTSVLGNISKATIYAGASINTSGNAFPIAWAYPGAVISVAGLNSINGVSGILPEEIVIQAHGYDDLTIDQTTGTEKSNNLFPELSPLGDINVNKKILWDTTHGVYAGYEPSQYYSNLKSLLISKGYNLTTINNGILNNPLDQYNVLVINLGSAWGSAYSPAEVQAIKNFVQNGGGLVVMGDNTGCPNANLNNVSNAFGTTLGISEIGDYISNHTTHPIFTGVTQFYYAAGGEIHSVPPSEEVAWSNNRGALSVATYGNGKVVITGDVNFADNSYISYANNQKLSENIFDWLSNPNQQLKGPAVMAASNYGQGRVIAIADGNLFAKDDYDGDGVIALYETDNEFVAVNSILWLAKQTLISGNAGMKASGAADPAGINAIKPDGSSSILAPGDIIHQINGPDYSNGLAWDGTNLWVSGLYNKTIYKVNSVNGAVISSFAAPGASSPSGLTWDGQYIWHSDFGTNKIYKLNPNTGAVVSQFTAPGSGYGVEGLAWDGQYLWAGDAYTQTIYKLNTNGTVISQIPAPGGSGGADGLAWDGANLWVLGYDQIIYKISTNGSIISSFHSPQSSDPNGLAWDGQYLWTDDGYKIYQIDAGKQSPVQNGGVVMFFFDAWDQPDVNASIRNLWLNSINWVAGGAQPSVPDISVDPPSFSFVLPQGVIDSQILTIQNTGGADLTFTITDSESGPLRQNINIEVPASQPLVDEDNALASNKVADISRPNAQTIKIDNSVISSTPVDVLLLGADPSNTLKSILESFPDIDAVGQYRTDAGTPTLAELQQYDVVIVWSDWPFFDNVALGNVLADYVDSGGKVIIQTFSWYAPFDLQGRIISDGYSPFVQDGENHYSYAELGLYDAGHPIMAGVNAMTDNYRDSVALTPGSYLVASWTDGEEFIATKGPVVGINSYPGDYYTWTGDYPTIIHNTILWLTGQTGGWLTESPTSGTVAPGSSKPVDVVVNTEGLAAGNYHAEMIISNNDPDENPVIVPVNLTVVTPVVVPDIDVVPSEINLTLPPGQVAARIMNISNLGNANLEFNISDRETGPLGISLVHGLNSNIEISNTADYNKQPTGNVSDTALLNIPINSHGVIPQSYELSSNNGYLSTGVLEHTIHQGIDIIYHVMGIAYNPNTNTYWHIDGGTTPSHIYEQRPDGTILSSGTVPLDGRAIVYRPQDGNIYIRSYSSGLYRLKIPFDGNVTQVLPNIFQNEQNGFAFADGGNIFDVYNGLVREYNFSNGGVLRTFSLNPNYPSGTAYPYNTQIASDGTDLYFLSQVDDVYVYYPNGTLRAIVDLSHPTFDTFNAPFSLSYTVNERLYVLDDAEDTLYGYRIKDQIPTGWLVESPMQGLVSPMNTVPIQLTINTTGLNPGNYHADIIINSNDPDENPVIVPVNLTVTAVPGTVVFIGSGNAPPGASVTVPLIIKNVTNVGVADITLTYNASVVHVTNAANSSFDFMDSNINNATGVTRIGAIQLASPGLNGSVKVADVTLKAVGAPGKSSMIGIVINELKDASPQQNTIPAGVVNGLFIVSDENPPVVTSPSAKPKVVDDNGIIISTLNVTVVDESPVASVTVNLSSIGGSSAHPMSNVPGTNVWTAHTGAFTAGVHNLQVNAIDIWGNFNSSVGIQLIVVAPAVVTIPDNITAAPGGEVTVPLMINRVSPEASLGVADINLVYNASVVHVTNAANSSFDFMDFTVNNATGKARIAAMQMASAGLSGNVTLAQVTLKAVGGVHQFSVLALSINELKDATPETNTVPGIVDNGSFKIAEITPPTVSNPNAAPHSIPDDTDNDARWGETSQLNATVSDESGVKSVTINLSALGKSAVQPMTRISGSNMSGVWSVTTNASTGKTGSHNLTVNATDIFGNSNTSVMIALRVLNNGDVNQDGAKTLADAMYLAKYVLDKPGFENAHPGASEVSGDGSVTLADAMYLAKNILNKSGFEVLH